MCLDTKLTIMALDHIYFFANIFFLYCFFLVIKDKINIKSINKLILPGMILRVNLLWKS